jgi:hypothetical protein
MSLVKITLMPASALPAHIAGMNKDMRAWTGQAARGECEWICSDCCCSEPKGMPDVCFHGHEACTAIIQRDKRAAMREGNEPS